ncbi:MAG: V-type ATP synthase subunit I [Oscillospiraceae bacterium]
MAVMQMERLHLCAMKRDRKKILELLQRRGVVEVRNAGDADEVFCTMDTSATRTLLEKNADTAGRAVEIVDKQVAVKKPMLSFLMGREAVPLARHNDFYKKQDTVLRKAQRAVQLEREVEEAKTEILRAQGQLEGLVPWLALPMGQTFAGTKKTAVFVGLLEGEHTREEILEKLAAAAPQLQAVHLEMVNESREQTCFYVVVLKKDAALAEEALRQIGFARPPGATRHVPAQQKKRLEEKISAAEATIAQACEEISAHAESREDFLYLQDHMAIRAEKYGVIERLLQSKHVFVLTGYVPSAVAGALAAELEATFDCSVQSEVVAADDDVPVLLKNNWFSRPSESVLESYSLPGKEDVDPTSVMSIFYYVMFGLMFSDAGYGLIMAGLCGLGLLLYKNMEPNWKKNLWLFFWCGVSTMFWGVMFGSFFGDAIGVVSGTFFGKALLVKPLWLDPLANPMTLLMFCLGIGIIHLSFGMVMKAVTLIKNKQYIDILYDVGFPLMLMYPLIVMVMGSDMFAGMAGFSLDLPAALTPVLVGVAGVGLVGITLFGGRESKNWGKRLLKGIYAVYNTLAGWLGDILSYARLLALGLATGVIGSVVNSMGTMPAEGAGVVVGAIAFVVIFVLGHALNFGINVLGAYVHSNRLEYVEFFGKFYEGGGVKFAPFGIHSKYYKIEEETQNA